MIGGTQQRGFKGARGGCRRRRRGKICVLLLLLLLLLLLGSMPLPTPQRIRASHDLGLIFQLKWLPCFARHAGRRCQLTETTTPACSLRKRYFYFYRRGKIQAKLQPLRCPEASQSVSFVRPGKLSQTSGRWDSHGPGHWRRRFFRCGGGGCNCKLHS